MRSVPSMLRHFQPRCAGGPTDRRPCLVAHVRHRDRRQHALLRRRLHAHPQVRRSQKCLLRGERGRRPSLLVPTGRRRICVLLPCGLGRAAGLVGWGIFVPGEAECSASVRRADRYLLVLHGKGRGQDEQPHEGNVRGARGAEGRRRRRRGVPPSHNPHHERRPIGLLPSARSFFVRKVLPLHSRRRIVLPFPWQPRCESLQRRSVRRRSVVRSGQLQHETRRGVY
mmetsp:Transcript_24759/g.45794  ORF Transcript_24759/g.45794 Transcript_24759/m.45794 type:complete len:226 (-) Transcript_24759:232-909(-)